MSNYDIINLISYILDTNLDNPTLFERHKLDLNTDGVIGVIVLIIIYKLMVTL